MLTTEEINSLRSDLMKILDKYKFSYYDFALEIGISERCLKKFLFQPDKIFSKRTEEKIKYYIQKELKKPVPLSIQEVNLLQAQNEGLKKQNQELQKEVAILKGKLDAYQMSENEMKLSQNSKHQTMAKRKTKLRSEEEIKKCIEYMTDIFIFLHNNELYAGYIQALEWVLQEDK